MIRDELVSRTREILSEADNTNPMTKVASDLLFEMVYMETEMQILRDEANHQNARYLRLIQLIRAEIPAKDMPYKVFAATSDLEELETKLLAAGVET